MTQQKPFDDTFKYELILLGGPTSEKYFLREMPMQWAERLDLLTRPCRHDQDNASMAYRYDHDNKSSWLRPLTPVIFSLITQTIIVLANHSKSDWQSNHKHRQEKKLQFNHNHQPKKLLKWLEKLHFDRQSFGLQQARSTEIVFVYIFSWKNKHCNWWKNFFSCLERHSNLKTVTWDHSIKKWFQRQFGFWSLDFPIITQCLLDCLECWHQIQVEQAPSTSIQAEPDAADFAELDQNPSWFHPGWHWAPSTMDQTRWEPTSKHHPGRSQHPVPASIFRGHPPPRTLLIDSRRKIGCPDYSTTLHSCWASF